LTEAVHDFEALRRELDLPSGQPILEAIASLPPEQASERTRRLDELELEIAARATAREGAHDLLSWLGESGARLGILTRNSRDNALATLAAAGLSTFFDADEIVGRDEAAPKPSPDGIHFFLARWRMLGREAVMVGNYLFDMQAGRAAGAATVLIDEGPADWEPWTDLRVRDLRALVELIDTPDANVVERRV
jgi:phosphoglycolate phosphatase-like HAD superfamily hydrolase